MTRVRSILITGAACAALALASAAPILAADGTGIDPQAAKAILAGVFTLSGATVIATIIAAFIQYGLKPLPSIGPAVDAHEQITSLGLWAAIIVYAVAALQLPIDLVSIFGYFLAWLGGAKLSGAAYDTAKTAVKTIKAVGSGEG